MRSLLLLIVVFFVTNCTQPPIKAEKAKPAPEHVGEAVDPELKVIVDEFFSLSKRFNITFQNEASIGFSNLDKYKKTAIGLCTYGDGWREIDIDKNYWKRATWLSKIALVYHELAHAYCDRRHDYGKNKKYQDPEIQAIIDIFNPERIPMSLIMTPPGFFDDGCPLSLMHPTIIDDVCTKKHYDHYVREMFERCDPF